MSTPAAHQPGPPRPGAWLRAETTAPTAAPTSPAAAPAPGARSGLAERLRDLPVAEHAAVLAEEHDRLHRLLATIDQL